jgi:hypothetical protein
VWWAAGSAHHEGGSGDVALGDARRIARRRREGRDQRGGCGGVRAQDGAVAVCEYAAWKQRGWGSNELHGHFAVAGAVVVAGFVVGFLHVAALIDFIFRRIGSAGAGSIDFFFPQSKFFLLFLHHKASVRGTDTQHRKSLREFVRNNY